ncbi:hypothetical protein F7725_018489 [Dissostichus mawsoni]|uniref:DNA mismatch repair proteins mutS family domain-containing protein n=1 Tax=Dissostichus mawsoni TaxID=36200 RepID=A0A7J5XRP9_DISMA|nr:hypothetical protein F7725_018489 [Dissostichus mawsoni]
MTDHGSDRKSERRGRRVHFGQPGIDGVEEEEEDSPAILLSVVAQHGQIGLCFFDSKDSTLNYMRDTPDDHELHLLARVIQEVSPHVIITSAKQERCMTRFLQQLGSNPDYKPEVVTYPYVDFDYESILNVAGLEVGKQRLLSAHLPFLPASTSERDKMSYLSSCISFDSPLMLRAVGALLKCLDRRRVGVELEDSSVGVPILQFNAYTLVLQIFKSELHPSVYKLHSGEKEGLSLYGASPQWYPLQDSEPLQVQIWLQTATTLLRRMSLSHTKVTDWQCLYKTVYNAVCIRDTVRHLPQSIHLFGISVKSCLTTSTILPPSSAEFIPENRFTIKPDVDPAIDVSSPNSTPFFLSEKRRMMGLSDFLTDVARRELEHLDARIPSCCVIYIPLIGFLLSVPRLPSMAEKEDFEIEGLDFMVLDLTAELDCLMALSSASQEYGYTSPKLSSHRKISITQGRHPLLELCSPVFVANSFQSSESHSRVKVITGPNSSGKSIYLKQVGLIVFMALIGSDVPAKEADIGLLDGIFTRMQSRESVSVGLSTFMIDLNQMAHAINSSSGNSLVLIDEFGKGTNTVDGLSLLAASISHWLRKPQGEVPHVLLATNFHSLLQLGLLPSSGLLSLLTLETAVDGDELVFLYQLKEGICQSSYAANIAKLAGLPASLVQRGVELKLGCSCESSQPSPPFRSSRSSHVPRLRTSSRSRFSYSSVAAQMKMKRPTPMTTGPASFILSMWVEPRPLTTGFGGEDT